MKVANSYASLLRGVSQQVPQDRADGQHTEQVNLLSDPVNGLTRRRGSVWQAEQVAISTEVPEAYNTDWENLGQSMEGSPYPDFSKYVTVPFDAAGKSYLILYRAAEWYASQHALTPPLFMVYNKTDRKFVPTRKSQYDFNMASVTAIAAATQVGKYLFFAAKDYPVTGASDALLLAQSDAAVQAEHANSIWGASPSKDTAVVWVRGGAYGRTYSLSLRTNQGVSYDASITTPASSYQGVLDTSDIPSSHPDYTKLVNDRVNDYESEVTKWIGYAARAIQPESIASALLNALQGAGFTGAHIAVNAPSHIFLYPAEGTPALTFDPIRVYVSDGGDGSLIRAVASEVESASEVSPVHFVGKVVKVRGKNSAESYYLKAYATDGSPQNIGNWDPVTWQEGPGEVRGITGGIFYATITPDSEQPDGSLSGGTFYYASSATMLATLVPGPHPAIPVSTAGDSDSAPMPSFVGQQITYMGTFQNRLLIGSGGTLSLSKTDDYLNFFRSTVLTLPGDDPFEMLPQGSADDELRYGVLYDRDLVLFGKRRQYMISGTVPLTPTSASMPVLASYEDGADASPVPAGGFIFYTKRAGSSAGIFQIQPGQTENSPESFPASSQIATYIKGAATQLAVATGSPSHLFVRSTQAPNSIYVFTYLDRQDGRKMDAWSRWDFSSELGYILGMASTNEGLLTFSLRRKLGGGEVYIVADLCPLETTLGTRPYLDSQISADAEFVASRGVGQYSQQEVLAVWGALPDDWAYALSGPAYNFIGSRLNKLDAPPLPAVGDSVPVIGTINHAYVIPTNPYMRDNKDKAILSGRLTVTKMTVAYRDTGGIRWAVTSNGVTNEVEFSGRILGSPDNIIGREPISTGQHNIPIGRETRQFNLRIAARDWHPFTLTAIEYTGQFFNRVQRF